VQRADELFDLVADVETYPEFIDLISALRITKKRSETEFDAEAIVAYKMIRESFRSNVSIDRDAMEISVKKAEKGGAVKDLQNIWKFYPIEDGSTIVDEFVKAASHIMNLFETRAGKTLKHIGDKAYDAKGELARLGLNSEGVV